MNVRVQSLRVRKLLTVYGFLTKASMVLQRVKTNGTEFAKPKSANTC